jgi:hypothetical protein
VSPRRFLILGPNNDPRWVCLDVYPIGDQWAAVIVADTVDPPRPVEGKGLRCFGHTAAEAKAVALRYLGRCTEQSEASRDGHVWPHATRGTP